MSKTTFKPRKIKPETEESLSKEGFTPVIAKLLAGRGVTSSAEMDKSLGKMLRATALKGAKEAGEIIAKAIQGGKKICIVADYDCDGASACAVMIRGMRLLGAESGSISYLVPDRQKDGYGLTPVIVERAIEQFNPDVLVTVDNGIASFDGVKLAIDKGLVMIVTDHHLPVVDDDGNVVVPEATVTVNPSQPGCEFQSKALCGAGVAFYTMLMTRAALREIGVYDAQNQPRMDGLLELVALATVCDVVKLDENNRRLVAHGIERIRTKGGNAGIRALFEVAGKKVEIATSTDLGFAVGPRINAAGRLSDMTIGIECLLAEDAKVAGELAGMLHKINIQRRDVEAGMVKEAEEMVLKFLELGKTDALVVFEESFHEGVVGIVAGRLKDAQHRPTFVFARAHDGNLKGSGRSIPGFHIRDALDLVSKKHPGLILKFGGHAMAAGCTIEKDGLDKFRDVFSSVAKEWLTQDMLENRVLTDGGLQNEDYTIDTVNSLNEVVWGQGFEPPVFVDKATVIEQKIVGAKHLKMIISVRGQRRDGIWFGRSEPLEKEVDLAYQIGINVWNGRQSVQMMVNGIVEG